MNQFETNIINIHQAKGQKWLQDLPWIIKNIKDKYGLSNLLPISNLSYNYVLSGFQGDEPVILKLGLDAKALKQEAMVLKAYAEYGAVKVLGESNGMLFLERAVPGISLKSYFPKQDKKAIHIASMVITKLHQAPIPSSINLPHIKDLMLLLDNDLQIPTYYLSKARNLRDHLLKSLSPSVLLHGDLHYDNILQAGQNWIVIDPKGVIGDASFEVAAFIRNPIPELLNSPNILDMIERRISIFAQTLKLDPERIKHWVYVTTILSWAYAIEDKGDIGYFSALSEILYHM